MKVEKRIGQIYSPHWPPDEVARCLDMWAEGMSIEDIAERLNRLAPSVAREVLSTRHSKIYEKLWQSRRSAGERRPVIPLSEVVAYANPEGGAVQISQ